MYLFQSSLSNDILEQLAIVRPDIKINVLKTFSDVTNDKINIAYNRPKNLNRLILDSGTFTLNNTGAKTISFVTKKLYKQFLHRHIHKYDWCFNFDEHHGNDGTETNVANQLYFEHHGLGVIPVIHNLSTEVEYYCKNSARYPLVAIGSMKQKKMKDVKAAVGALYHKHVAVHLFSVGPFTNMFDIPVYSSDSTSYMKWSNLRRMCYFDTIDTNVKKNKGNGYEFKISLDSFNKRDKPNKEYYKNDPRHKLYQNWLSEHLGLTIDELQIQDKMLMANSYYYWFLEQLITSIHTSKGYNFSFLPEKYHF